MYIRRTRLEYGISDDEFEYFARHLYHGQKSDRSRMEDDKEKQEEKVVSMMLEDMECCKYYPNLLPKCGLDFTSDDPGKCQLSRDSVQKLLAVTEDAGGVKTTDKKEFIDHFELEAREFKKCCYMYEECHDVVPLDDQLMKELHWWEREHEALLSDKSQREGKGKLYTVNHLETLRMQAKRDEALRLRQKAENTVEMERKRKQDAKADLEMEKKEMDRYMREQRRKKGEAQARKEQERAAQSKNQKSNDQKSR
jgi:hypothetical protein